MDNFINPDNSWFRYSCDELKCQGFCVDKDTKRPNGKIFYKSNHKFGDMESSVAQKDWDGTFHCVKKEKDCAVKTYGIGTSSGNGWWCFPKDTSPKYQCFDMACEGFKDWASDTSSSFSPADMSWRCHEGTCYPQCATYTDKPVINIGADTFDMNSLNCHQNPYFIRAIRNPTGQESAK